MECCGEKQAGEPSLLDGRGGSCASLLDKGVTGSPLPVLLRGSFPCGTGFKGKKTLFGIF